MGWIRELKEVSKKGINTYFIDYEIASESRIPGGFDYKKDFIKLNLLSEKENHLFRYNLRIKFLYGSRDFNKRKYTKNGYCFMDGIAGEIICLLSLFFRCRFYLISSNSVDTDGKPYSKRYRKLMYKPIATDLHPPLFEREKNNFCVGFEDFLNKIKKLDEKYHQQIAHACNYYLMGLKEIGVLHEMFFVRMVSAIEALAQFIELDKEDDIFKGKNLKNFIHTEKLTQDEFNELETVFNVRKSKKKFIHFIKCYSKNFFKGGRFKARHTRILKAELAPTISNIYNARSEYLHAGKSMYLTSPMRDISRKWDTDSSLGMMIDNRKFSKKEKLPFTYWFDKLVRHCILNFIEEKAF